VQVVGLLGNGGILPAADLLVRAEAAAPGLDRFRLLPTLFWLAPVDVTLVAIAWTGAALGGVAAAFVSPAWLYAALCLLYLSLTSIGGDFFHFQWDALLLETGFLATFTAPLVLLPRRRLALESSELVRALLVWLLFRLTLGSGLVKLLSGDPTWWNLTALGFHHETQPLPTWTAWWAHQLPPSAHAATTAIVLGVEIVVPFLVWIGRGPRLAAAALLAILQIGIALLGNFGFFNLLTLVLLLPLVDDEVWRRGRPPPSAALAVRRWPQWVLFPVAVLIALLSTAAFLERLGASPRILAPLDFLRRPLAPLDLVSGYGLFAAMTTTRDEIEVEGSADGRTWRAYRFRWKPGPPEERPRFATPHLPRLDWQMWFAALGPVDRSPWFRAFARRLLEGSPVVLGLLAENPFPDAPPRFVRATIRRQRFTTLDEGRRSGAWWRPGEPRPYLAPVSLDDSRRR
jgi:lipase maturation factor 1